MDTSGSENERIAKIREEYEARLKAEREQAEGRIRAYQQEFTTAISSLSVEEHREFIKSLIPDAKAKFTYLLNHARSEAVSMSAIKYIFGTAFGESSNEPGDKLSELLAQLTSH